MDLPFLTELKRRRVFRALVAWGIGSFAVLQIIEPIMHGLHWPDAVLSYVVVALALGFPAVVALAWVFDVNEGRIERAPPSGPRGIRLPLLLLGVGLLAATPGLAWYFLHTRSRPAESADIRSIAVLPFASVSPGDENRYFADAMHIELLSQLARIGDLKVISRTSVLQYREGARNVREIGAALGVGSVLEGSVQRAGGRVRIQAQLIDAASDRQLWAEHYDRDMTDLFGIQTAVAEDIAKSLRARLSPREQSEIARRPTPNPEAYALYLRASEYSNRPGPAMIDSIAIAEGLYRKALDLDPRFALAHARLSRAHGVLYWFGRDHSAARMAKAREEAERALALQPDLSEAHAAMGFVRYWGERDYPRALEEFEIACKGFPEAIEFVGYVKRRQGKFDEALANLIEAGRLDPVSPRLLSERSTTLIQMRRYAEADQVLDRLVSLAPDLVNAKLAKAYLLLMVQGNSGPAREILQRLASVNPPPSTVVPWSSSILAHLLQLDPASALALLPSAPEMIGGEFRAPARLLLGLARDALGGDTQRALADYQAARILLEIAIENDREDPILHARLGRAYAGLGRKADALREARRALEILPVSKDAMTGPLLLEQLALIEALVGDTDAAIDHLEELLRIPSGVSVHVLRIDPAWAPIRSHPRFQKLVAESRL